MEVFGQLLFDAGFITPLITIPLMWKYGNQRKIYRILIGLLLAALLSVILFYVGFSIAWKNGGGRIM